MTLESELESEYQKFLPIIKDVFENNLSVIDCILRADNIDEQSELQVLAICMKRYCEINHNLVIIEKLCSLYGELDQETSSNVRYARFADEEQQERVAKFNGHIMYIILEHFKSFLQDALNVAKQDKDAYKNFWSNSENQKQLSLFLKIISPELIGVDSKVNRINREIRKALYANLELAVEKSPNEPFTQDLIKAFQRYFPNPVEEEQDKMTRLRTLPNYGAAGYNEIKLGSAASSTAPLLLLGSRPLLRKISEEQKREIKERLSKLPANEALTQVNEILKEKGGSTFNVTLWDIIYQGLQKKLRETNRKLPIDSLVITIQSLQELSELFDENGLPRQLAGKFFLTSQKEVDEYLEKISSLLYQLKIISSHNAIEITLQRVPLYDHDVFDPTTGEIIISEKCDSQVADLLNSYETSDLTYVHCYSAKQRSPWMVGLLAIHKNIEDCESKIREASVKDKDKLIQDLAATLKTPDEIFEDIHQQRSQARRLSSTSPDQQQIAYEMFFKRIEYLGDDKADFFVAALLKKENGAEIIARNLQIYLRGFEGKKQYLANHGREAEWQSSETNFHNFMFRVLRQKNAPDINEIAKQYSKHAQKVGLAVGKTIGLVIGAIITAPITLPLILLASVTPLGKVVREIIGKLFSGAPKQARQTLRSEQAFERSFVPSMFLKFINECPEALLKKKPQEIARFLKGFLLYGDRGEVKPDNFLKFVSDLKQPIEKLDDVRKELGGELCKRFDAVVNAMPRPTLEVMKESSTAHIVDETAGQEELIKFMWDNKLALELMCLRKLERKEAQSFDVVRESALKEAIDATGGLSLWKIDKQVLDELCKLLGKSYEIPAQVPAKLPLESFKDELKNWFDKGSSEQKQVRERCLKELFHFCSLIDEVEKLEKVIIEHRSDRATVAISGAEAASIVEATQQKIETKKIGVVANDGIGCRLSEKEIKLGQQQLAAPHEITVGGP